MQSFDCYIYTSHDSLIITGWVREVIYDRNEDGTLCSKAKEVVYHAPLVPGSKTRTFKSQADLRPYRKFIAKALELGRHVLILPFHSKCHIDV